MGGGGNRRGDRRGEGGGEEGGEEGVEYQGEETTKTTRTNKRGQMESRGKRTLTREQEINQGMDKLPGKNRNRASLKQRH